MGEAMFLTAYSSDRVSFYDEERAAMLPSMICLFAESVGKEESSATWAVQGLDDARSTGNLAGISTLGQFVVSHLIRQKLFVEAIDAARELSAACVAFEVIHRRGTSVFAGGHTVDAVLRGADPI